MRLQRLKAIVSSYIIKETYLRKDVPKREAEMLIRSAVHYLYDNGYLNGVVLEDEDAA